MAVTIYLGVGTQMGLSGIVTATGGNFNAKVKAVTVQGGTDFYIYHRIDPTKPVKTRLPIEAEYVIYFEGFLVESAVSGIDQLGESEATASVTFVGGNGKEYTGIATITHMRHTKTDAQRQAKITGSMVLTSITEQVEGA